MNYVDNSAWNSGLIRAGGMLRHRKMKAAGDGLVGATFTSTLIRITQRNWRESHQRLWLVAVVSFIGAGITLKTPEFRESTLAPGNLV